MVGCAVTDVAVELLPVVPCDEGEGRLLEVCAGLLAENERLWGENERLRARCERLVARVSALEEKVEELRRQAKRQAAPFSRGETEERPRRPGRRPGERYGRKGHRAPPEEVDETVEAPLAGRCECGGEIDQEDVAFQYQEELPEPVPIRRAIKIFVGRCRCCGKRHQGRHPYQTSDAVGAAGSMLGPRAVALATQLNKELGLSPQKTSKALLQFGIRITPGGVVQAIARQARRLEPTYDALALAVRHSSAVAPDETGWRVAARKRWLWAFVGDGVTVYLIGGRGYEDACGILGEDFSGVLERDGWAPYRSFKQARHQTCYAHLLKRAGELIEDSIAGQARVPHAVRRLLKDALALRQQRDRHLEDPESEGGEVIDAEEFGLRVTDLNERADKLLEIKPTHEPNRRLLAHLRTERGHMFTFLTEPGVQATNWRAEQALRPAIVNRKNWGGNRTETGARTQVVAMSVIRTARQQNVDPIELMAAAQRDRVPVASPQLRIPIPRAGPALAA